MTWLYDLIFIIFILFSLPVYLLQGKFHSGLLMRLGIIPKEVAEKLKVGPHLWVHAVSVGEVNAVSGLIEKFHQEFPQERIVISTVTATGNRLAKTIAGINDAVIYLPLDLSFIIRKFARLIKPWLFITTETEIWPNLIVGLKQKNVPVILVNGRISLGSFRGYSLVKYFLRNVFGYIKLFCMQTEGDARRIISLGALGSLVKVTGNMKFDMDFVSLPAANRFNKDNGAQDYAGKLRWVLGRDAQLFIAGSTHSGEEEIIVRVYQKLSLQFGHLKLLIAPRHIERALRVEKIVQRFGFNALRLSNFSAGEANTKNGIFILDTIGQLRRLYDLATIVFIGGSLVKKGGHNIIEPAFFGKPVIVGPFMFNFKDITNVFLEKNAVIKVADEMELLEELRILLLSQTKREAMGRLCQETIKENRGATDLTLELIKKEIVSND